jgi:AcrR family transcriptional regulator
MTRERIFDRWRRLGARQGSSFGASTLTKPERTRRRLLGYALQLFEERGYKSTSPADIAAAAGVSRATFFTHFSTKAAIVEDISRTLGTYWAREPVVLGETTEQHLRRFITFILLESGGALEVAVLHDFIRTYGENFDAGAGPGTLHAHMESILARLAQEEGWASLWSGSSRAHFFLASLTRLRADIDHLPKTDAADIIATVLLAGMRAARV